MLPFYMLHDQIMMICIVPPCTLPSPHLLHAWPVNCYKHVQK